MDGLLMRREQARAYCTPLALLLLAAFFCTGAYLTVRGVIGWLT